MLETYNYEQTLMVTCKNLMNHDLHVHLRSLTRAAVKGYVPKSDQCSICLKHYLNQRETDSVIVFRFVYFNMPLQVTAIFYGCKNDNF